ncbi:hypothetical protein FACS1894191_6150 [Clostridia bacterium]|nr:hypothetical protein FACS1894191_6150 [Clostridia bacterium]
MRYVRARDIFPAKILKLIQTYVDGEYVYIPRKEDGKKSWGESTVSRREIAERNEKIYREYQGGADIHKLSETYYLSEKSVYRIVSCLKKTGKNAGR